MIRLKEELGPIYCNNCKQLVYYGEEELHGMFSNNRKYGTSLVCKQCGRPDGFHISNDTNEPSKPKSTPKWNKANHTGAQNNLFLATMLIMIVTAIVMITANTLVYFAIGFLILLICAGVVMPLIKNCKTSEDTINEMLREQHRKYYR